MLVPHNPSVMSLQKHPRGISGFPGFQLGLFRLSLSLCVSARRPGEGSGLGCPQEYGQTRIQSFLPGCYPKGRVALTPPFGSPNTKRSGVEPDRFCIVIEDAELPSLRRSPAPDYSRYRTAEIVTAAAAT